MTKLMTLNDHGCESAARNAKNCQAVSAFAFSPWNSSSTAPPPAPSLESADAIIHLAGESVARRWNPEI